MRKIVLWASAACAISVSHTLLAPPILAQATIYNVAPQPLEQALFEFAEEARLSINFSGLNLDGLMSNGARGHTSIRTSLRSILRGTGIGFRINDNSSVQLHKIIPKRAGIAAVRKAVLPAGIDDTIIEDLVVTANKRASTAFKLPVSVSAVSSVTLEDWSADDFQAVAPHLAGVLTTNLGPGQNKIFVRGLSDGVFSDRTQAIVGVYIDEAPINYSDTNPDIRLFDVERIELLRGPQGTLYGSGSLAGVYRVITAKPSVEETSVRVRATTSFTKESDMNGALDFAYNQPLTNKLALRLTGYADLKSGYIDNTFLGIRDINNTEIYGVRPSLRWHVAENWIVDLVGNFQAIKIADSQYYYSNFGQYRRDNEIREPYDDTFFHGNLTLRGEFSDYQLTSSTAYVDRSIKKQTDASDALPFLNSIEQVTSDIFTRSDVSLFSSKPEFLELFQSDIVAYLQRNDIKIFSHETRIQSELGGNFEWLAGAFFQGRKQNMEAVLAFTKDDDPTGTIFYALGEDRNETSDELALFGELTYSLTNKFSVTAGARYARAWLSLNNVSVLALNDETITAIGKKSKESFIPKFAMRYEWTEDIQTYGLVSLGYRIGGLNINTPLSALVAADKDHVFEGGIATDFQSDNLMNVELGLKSYWFDRMLGINLSAFYVKWFDLQSDQIGPSGLPLTVNVGEARINGYELEFNMRPIPGLEILGSFFWNDSEMLEDNPFLGIRAGDNLPAIPNNTASLSMIYEFAQGHDWTAAIQSDYAYIAESSLNFDEATSASMGGYGILNAKLQVTKDIWKFGMFARNLLDSQANTFSYGNGFRLAEKNQITPPRPLTVGLFIETSF